MHGIVRAKHHLTPPTKHATYFNGLIFERPRWKVRASFGLWCKLRGRVIFADSKTQRKQTGMLGIDELFKGRHFDREIIILCVRWYLRFKLSFRDLVEMMAERGVDLAHTTIMRWIQRYVPEFERRWNRFACNGGSTKPT